MILLTLSLVALSLARWRGGWSWNFLTAAFALFAISDIVLVFVTAQGTYDVTSVAATGYPIAALLIGVAALRPAAPMPRGAAAGPGLLILPFFCVAINVVFMLVDQFVTFPNDDLILPAPAIALGMARAAMTLGDLRRLYESRRFERGFEDATIGMAMIAPDMRYLRVNDALVGMFGFPAEQLLQTTTVAITHPDDLAMTREYVEESLRAGEAPPFRKRFLRADGSAVETLVTSTLIQDDDGTQYFFSQIQDVTHENRAKRQQAAIAELGHLALELTDVTLLSERAVRVVADTLAVEVCSVLAEDPDTGAMRFEARSAAPLAEAMLPGGAGSQSGYTLLTDAPVIANDLAGETRFTVPGHLLTDGLERGVSVPIRARRAAPRVLIAHERCRDRRFVDDDVPFLEAVANVLASALDRAAAEEELRRRALEDPLTGLANRTLLGSHLERALHSVARHEDQIAVMMLDLDRFKYLNDTLGHSAGDELLVAVAERLTSAVREADLVARLGGDEFVVVCSDAGSDAAIAEVAQRVVDVLAPPFAVADRELYVSASVGVAVVGPDGRATAESLLRDSDAAMYRAKERGGARYEVFDDALRARLVRRVSTEEALRRALDRDELRVRYQPIVRPETGEVAAFEALLRWSHPERGVVSPAEFIPVAEETDLIVPIGAWVLRTACEQAAVWNAQRGPGHPLSMSVNLSPRQVRPELIDEVRRALEGTIHPRLLVLEITESLLLEPVATSGVINDLRALGVRVALDDFGSGYSSLSYLQSYPLDFVKLDRGFVQTLDDSAATGAVVRAAIQMAGALGLRVVAEGVQRPEQLDRLRELGCDYVQGFLFAPALEPDEAAELLGGARSDLAHPAARRARRSR